MSLLRKLDRDTLQRQCKLEVEALHAVFVAWFQGTRPQADLQSDLERRLQYAFSHVAPNGMMVLGRPGLLSQLQDKYGCYHDRVFEIDIYNVQLLWTDTNQCLCTYEEWQSWKSNNNSGVAAGSAAGRSGDHHDGVDYGYEDPDASHPDEEQSASGSEEDDELVQFGRLSTCLLERTSDGQAFTWIHVHETWLEAERPPEGPRDALTGPDTHDEGDNEDLSSILTGPLPPPENLRPPFAPQTQATLSVPTSSQPPPTLNGFPVPEAKHQQLLQINTEPPPQLKPESESDSSSSSSSSPSEDSSTSDKVGTAKQQPQDYDYDHKDDAENGNNASSTNSKAREVSSSNLEKNDNYGYETVENDGEQEAEEAHDQQQPAPSASADSSASASGDEHDDQKLYRRVIVLMSNACISREQLSQQKMAFRILEAEEIPYEEVDGTDFNHRGRREVLFNISGKRGKYPQFFVAEGSDQIAYWGDWNRFDQANYQGMLKQELGMQDVDEDDADSGTRSGSGSEEESEEASSGGEEEEQQQQQQRTVEEQPEKQKVQQRPVQNEPLQASSVQQEQYTVSKSAASSVEVLENNTEEEDDEEEDQTPPLPQIRQTASNAAPPWAVAAAKGEALLNSQPKHRKQQPEVPSESDSEHAALPLSNKASASSATVASGTVSHTILLPLPSGTNKVVKEASDNNDNFLSEESQGILQFEQSENNEEVSLEDDGKQQNEMELNDSAVSPIPQDVSPKRHISPKLLQYAKPLKWEKALVGVSIAGFDIGTSQGPMGDEAWYEEMGKNLEEMAQSRSIPRPRRKICLPEMVFPTAHVAIEGHGFWLSWDVVDTLESWAKSHQDITIHSRIAYNGVSVLKSKDASLWETKRKHKVNDETASSVFHYDWTFSTPFVGRVDGGQWQQLDESGMRMSLLTDQSVPILFFDDIILYEDDMHDNGQVQFSIKLRVMPSCAYFLARLWVRVDHVLVRVRETRVLVDFFGMKPQVFRDISWRELKWEQLKANGLPLDVRPWHLQGRETPEWNELIRSIPEIHPSSLPQGLFKHAVLRADGDGENHPDEDDDETGLGSDEEKVEMG